MFRSSITLLAGCLLIASIATADETSPLAPRQITFGPKHHFFGYIGQCRTTPWNSSGRYLLCLRTDFQDHMPTRHDAAEIVLLDADDDYREIVIERTRGWNFQQGTMFYWNPHAPETQFFFNDRDPATGKVFCVLYDIESRQRVREFRFDDTPVGNSGARQRGGAFLAINYGRLARLRAVTGYPEAFDWTIGENHPEDDGIFHIDVATGAKKLLVSYARLRDALMETHPEVVDKALFINHTLWNRPGDLIYFYARGDFYAEQRLNVPFTMKADGTELRPLATFIGGHPDWGEGHEIIGATESEQVVYDCDRRAITRVLGGPEVFPDPGGDISLSFDGEWLVNGYRQDKRNAYVFFPMRGGEPLRTAPRVQDGYTSGDLRIDGSPTWNRRGTQILFPSLADDENRTRQVFLVDLPPRE